MRDQKVPQCGRLHGSSWALFDCATTVARFGVNAPNGYGFDWLRCVSIRLVALTMVRIQPAWAIMTGGNWMFRTIGAIASIAALGVGLCAAPAFANKANDTLNVVWDQLIERDPETFQYKPELATAWRWIDDLTLELDLRKGVKFQDGQPFDADDVVYTLNFVSNPANKVLNTTNVGWIKHAEKIDQY